MANSISPCGINCSDCDAFKATINNDLELLNKLAEQYREHFKKDISITDLHCDGCMNDGPKISFCNECDIRKCVLQKQYTTCAECEDFPCEKGSFIWTETSVSKANLIALRKNK